MATIKVFNAAQASRK